MTDPLILIPTHPLDPAKPHIIAGPDACALCGNPRRGHGQRYAANHKDGNPLGYIAPDNATRLARMRARHAARATT